MPYWKIAQDFLEEIESDIFCSNLVLREIESKLDPYGFGQMLELVRYNTKFKMIEEMSEDYSFARKLESESQFEIGFFDCVHIALCKRLGLILVTRDNDLLKFAKDYIIADRPENLF